jgi:hypothetical protein
LYVEPVLAVAVLTAAMLTLVGKAAVDTNSLNSMVMTVWHVLVLKSKIPTGINNHDFIRI